MNQVTTKFSGGSFQLALALGNIPMIDALSYRKDVGTSWTENHMKVIMDF